MEPETEQQRAEREAELKRICEPLMLEVNGSDVIVNLTGLTLDASALDHKHIVPALIHTAYTQGIAAGRAELSNEVYRLLKHSI